MAKACFMLCAVSHVSTLVEFQDVIMFGLSSGALIFTWQLQIHSDFTAWEYCTFRELLKKRRVTYALSLSPAFLLLFLAG